MRPTGKSYISVAAMVADCTPPEFQRSYRRHQWRGMTPLERSRKLLGRKRTYRYKSLWRSQIVIRKRKGQK